MKPFGLAIISLALVVAASASPLLNTNSKTTDLEIPVFADYKAGDKCPAKHFNDGCNDCVCGADGITAACTLKACLNFDGLKRAVRSDKIPVFPTYKVGDKCPAKVFNDGCNSCVCGNDGVTVACTLKLCLEKRQTRADAEDIPVVYGYQQGDKCPAQKFYDNCNRCFCLPDGHSAGCTRMACPPRRETRSVEDVPVISGYKHGDKCPAKHFFDQCNKCVCAEDGHSAACTKMACPVQRAAVPHIDNFDEIQKCTPFQHFQKKCNGCICAADGVSAICTLMVCAE